MKRWACLITAVLLLAATACGCISVEFNGQDSEEGDFNVQLPGVSVEFNDTPAETPEETPEEMPEETQMPATPFDFDTMDLDGKAINTREVAAEHDLTLVNFWATWCGPCVNEMPELQSLHERFSSQTEGADVAILGVWLDTENPADLKSVLEYTGAAYPMVKFCDEMQEAVALQYIPATIFLDREGNIVGEPIVGAQDEEGWLAEIEARLASLELG